MSEQLVDRDLAVGDEAGAFRLPRRREGPGTDDGQLLAQHVTADVERHAVALADEAHRSPGPRALYGDQPSGRRARGVEGEVGAKAAGQILDRSDGIV